MNTDIKNTRRKLTILFTIIVFLLAFLLEFVYFTTKFYSIRRFDLNNFINISNNIETNIKSWDNFIKTMWFWDMHRKEWPWFANNFSNRNPINFLVIDNNTNVIVFDRVFENIDEELLFDNISNINNGVIKNNEWYFFKKNIINNDVNNYELVFFKKTNYSFTSYLLDLLLFILLTLIFSIIFYFIWLEFISKILKPVEENIDDMKNFIYNAWHELKTPISIINWNLQLLNEFKKYDKSLTNESIEEIKKLDKLIVWLIELSDISNNQTLDELNITNEIEEIIENYKNLIKSNNIIINKKLAKNIILKANKQYFYILFSNLLNNAIKYNREWWEINIDLTKNILIITDTWIWIKNEYLNKIFDRFFQIDPSRKTEWFWIWLSLVKKISDIYKWKINIESDEWKYTKITINFK